MKELTYEQCEDQHHFLNIKKKNNTQIISIDKKKQTKKHVNQKLQSPMKKLTMSQTVNILAPK